MSAQRAQRRGERLATLVLSVALTALITVVGAVAGPTWQEAPAQWEIHLDSTRVDITDTHGEPVHRPPTGTYDVVRSELRVDLGHVAVEAFLYEPAGAPPGPGVVLIHGAGTVAPDAFQEHAHALAASGIRALVPAKRMDTYSVRERDYVAMAQDYLASWRLLREMPGVDPDRVGLYGESEGAWIVPVAASVEPAVSFLVLASAPVVTPRQQAAYAVANYLAETNVPRGLFRSIPRALGADIPGGGFDYIDFDVRPYRLDLNQPVLMLYGAKDASMPIVQGVRTTRADLAAGGNTAFTARYFAGADHGLNVDGTLAPQVSAVLIDWVWGLPETAQAQHPVAGAPAQQRFLAGPVPEPAWYASGNFLVYSTIGVIAVSIVGLLITAGAALAHRPPLPAHRHALAAALAAFATLAVLLGYITQVADLAQNYQTNDLLTRGGWALVQASGIGAVLILATSMRTSFTAGRGGEGRRPTGITGVWLCHAGALMLLALAAYWGMFPATW